MPGCLGARVFLLQSNSRVFRNTVAVSGYDAFSYKTTLRYHVICVIISCVFRMADNVSRRLSVMQGSPALLSFLCGLSSCTQPAGGIRHVWGAKQAAIGFRFVLTGIS